MSDMSNFDDFTKKQLGNYSPDVPAHIWENIAAKREKKKPYPFAFKFFNKKNLLLAAVLVTLIMGVYFLQKKDSFNNLKDAETGTKQLINKKSETPVNQVKEKGINNEGKTQGEISTNKEPAVKSKSFDSVSAISISALPSRNNLKETIENKNKLHYKKGKVNISSNLNTVNDLPGEKVTSAIDNDEDISSIETHSFTSQLFSPEKITASDVKGLSLDKSKLPALLSPPCPGIEKNAAGNKYYIELYAGPDYAVKKFSDTANSALLQKRKESLSFRSAFSAGFRYTRVFNNGASFRVGFNYSQINEKFSFVQSNITQVTYITDPVTGDTTGTFITTGTRYKTTNNRYHTFDIPLVLGFEIGNGRVHANFNAGVVVNIYSWQKGESLDTSFRPVNISTGKSNALYQNKTNIGTGFLGSISVYYKLNDQFHLFAEPYWRYNFSPMNKEMLTLQEKFTTIGIRLGVRLDL